MGEVGVKYACLSFDYALRTPNVKWGDVLEESGIERIMVVGGTRLKEEDWEQYIDFLNEWEEIIDFAVVPDKYFSSQTTVPLALIWNMEAYSPLDILAVQSHKRIFDESYLRDFQRDEIEIHGLGVYSGSKAKYLTSANTGDWLKGKFGWSYYFSDGLLTYKGSQQSYRKYIVGMLNKAGYSVDYMKVYQNDWKEIAKLNCVAFKQYQDWLNDRN